MKLRTCLTALTVFTCLAFGHLYAADAKPAAAGEPHKGKCCMKAEKNGKKCDHECCMEAAKAGKNCEKCGGTNAPAAKK